MRKRRNNKQNNFSVLFMNLIVSCPVTFSSLWLFTFYSRRLSECLNQFFFLKTLMNYRSCSSECLWRVLSDLKDLKPVHLTVKFIWLVLFYIVFKLLDFYLNVVFNVFDNEDKLN